MYKIVFTFTSYYQFALQSKLDLYRVSGFRLKQGMKVFFPHNYTKTWCLSGFLIFSNPSVKKDLILICLALYASLQLTL